MESANLSDLGRERVLAVRERWLELCHWDPALPPDNVPAMVDEMVDSVADAMQSPQPLGWGLDPAVEAVIERFAGIGDSPATTSAQLVCLREAFDQVVIGELPEGERLEGMRRLTMITQRAMIAATEEAVRRLQAAALTDPLTGLFNRRAFQQDLERARAHHERVDEPYSVAMIDLVGLKAINDRDGHGAGDDALGAMGDAIRQAVRTDDRGYRIGGDEFALILPNTVLPDPNALVQRLEGAGAPCMTIGVASVPGDPIDRLVEVADTRLYAARREAHDRAR
jgi:diguanylate cyclase (GGDEF)-like protein